MFGRLMFITPMPCALFRAISSRFGLSSMITICDSMPLLSRPCFSVVYRQDSKGVKTG